MSQSSQYKSKYLAQLKKARTTRQAASSGSRKPLDAAQLQNLRRLGKAAQASRRADILAIMTSSKAPVKQRIAAVQSIAPALADHDADLQSALQVLADASEPSELRIAILNALKLAAFSHPRFTALRPTIFSALRNLGNDPDHDVRGSVLGTLVAYKDDYAQKLLRDGLTDEKKAVLRPAKAIQILGYDLHAGNYNTLRGVLRSSKDPEVLAEAVRHLAADAGSRGELERLLKDRKQPGEVRRACAQALHAQDPEAFHSYARKSALDSAEHEDIRAASLTALTIRRPGKRAKADADFEAKLEASCGRSTSKLVKKAFLRYKQSRSLDEQLHGTK